MSERFEIVEVNPNDAVGGGGCLCQETKSPDCKPPYAVFYHQEMENNLSPHAVVCLSCAEAVVRAVDQGDTLSGGERGDSTEVIESDAVEVPEVPEL